VTQNQIKHYEIKEAAHLRTPFKVNAFLFPLAYCNFQFVSEIKMKPDTNRAMTF
jgi:hypothetical protein